MKFHKWLLCALASTVLFFDTYSITLQAGNLKNLISESGIKFGGWINGGVTFNPSQAGGYNGPVIFADQANRFQLNQLNLFVQRPVVSTGNAWDIGGRVDFMFGTDAIFTQAFGVPTFDVNTGAPSAGAIGI